MSSTENDPARLFRIRKTVMKMLRNRGYIVNEEELTMPIDGFKAKFGEYPNREQLVMLCEKMDDPSDTIFVFFPEDARVGMKPVRSYCTRMLEEGVKRAIIVVKEGLTPVAKQSHCAIALAVVPSHGITNDSTALTLLMKALNEVANSFKLEYFTDSELLVDITEHNLVPKHVVLTKDEKLALLKRYKLKDSQLPRMQLSDPISRYYGLSRGQVVRIVRPSETAGRYVTYRIVV